MRDLFVPEPSRTHVRLLLPLAIVALLAALAGAGATRYAHAQTVTPVGCSATDLANAISGANSSPAPVTLLLAAGCTYDLSSNGALNITGNITIEGNGATITGSTSSAFYVNPGQLTLSDITLTGNTNTTPDYETGGAIQNYGTVTISNSLLSNNSALDGGAIDDLGALTVTNTTFYNNSAEFGSVISNRRDPYAPITLTNVTFSNNSGASGVIVGAATVQGDIFEGNTPTCSSYSLLTSNGYNVSDDNADCNFNRPTDVVTTGGAIGLAALANNGGPTETMAITSASAAYGIIPAAQCPTLDQRGYFRLADGDPTACDAGAFELDAPPATPTTTTASAAFLDLSTGPAISITANVSASGSPAEGGTVTFLNGATTLCTVALNPNGQASCTSVITPAAASPHDLIVIYSGSGPYLPSQATTDAVSHLAQPTIVTVQTVPSPSGMAWVVNGGGFSGANSVTVCGVAVPFTVVNDNVLLIGIPAVTGPQHCSIVVTAAGGTGSSGTVTVVPKPVPGAPVNVGPTGTTTPSPTPPTTPSTTPTPTPACTSQTLTLSGQWTLIAWPGASGTPVADALAGDSTSCTTNVTSQVAVVWGFDSTTQAWHAYFPSAGSIPGANDLAVLNQGSGYFVALINPAGGVVSWMVETAG